MAKVCYSPDNFNKNNQQCKNSLSLTKTLINLKNYKNFQFSTSCFVFYFCSFSNSYSQQVILLQTKD